MESPQIVTFLSDFGWGGGYVAACEATIASVCPSVRVMHVSHDVPAGDVAAGALVLARVAGLCPVAIHLAVVDPGVGTARRPVLLSAARGDFLIGPDNGLLLDAAQSLGGVVEAWELDIRQVRAQAGLPLDRVSTTFHGRDLFAPGSALLASGIAPAALGRPLEIASLVHLPSMAADATADCRISAAVIEIDRFGNVALAWDLTDALLTEGLGTGFQVEVANDEQPEWTATTVRTYGDLLPGQLGLIRDSWGKAALALNGASAAEFLGVRRGMIVTLTPVPSEGWKSPAKSPGKSPDNGASLAGEDPRPAQKPDR